MGFSVLSLRQRDGGHANPVRRPDRRRLAADLAELDGCHIQRKGPHPELSYRNVHFLHRILHRLSILLRQHLRGLDHHHVPGAGRS